VYRFLGLVAVASFSACLVSGPSVANTLISPGNSYTLNPAGSFYNAQVTSTAAGPITDFYTFTVTQDEEVTAQLSVVFAPPQTTDGVTSGIDNAEVAWFKGAIAGPSQFYTDSTGNSIVGPNLTVFLVPGTYTVEVLGSYLGAGSEYQLGLGVQAREGGRDSFAPLPAGIILFASGLGGLGLFGRRRRKKSA
jgi:hypothetical protein